MADETRTETEQPKPAEFATETEVSKPAESMTEPVVTEEVSEETEEGEEQADKLNQTVEMRDIGPCKKHVKVTVDRNSIDSLIDKKFSELVVDTPVAGFRPGKAPRKIIERRFRKDVSDQVRAEVLLTQPGTIGRETTSSLPWPHRTWTRARSSFLRAAHWSTSSTSKSGPSLICRTTRASSCSGRCALSPTPTSRKKNVASWLLTAAWCRSRKAMPKSAITWSPI